MAEDDYDIVSLDPNETDQNILTKAGVPIKEDTSEIDDFEVVSTDDPSSVLPMIQYKQANLKPLTRYESDLLYDFEEGKTLGQKAGEFGEGVTSGVESAVAAIPKGVVSGVKLAAKNKPFEAASAIQSGLVAEPLEDMATMGVNALTTGTGVTDWAQRKLGIIDEDESRKRFADRIEAKRLQALDKLQRPDRAAALLEDYGLKTEGVKAQQAAQRTELPDVQNVGMTANILSPINPYVLPGKVLGKIPLTSTLMKSGAGALRNLTADLIQGGGKVVSNLGRWGTEKIGGATEKAAAMAEKIAPGLSNVPVPKVGNLTRIGRGITSGIQKLGEGFESIGRNAARALSKEELQKLAKTGSVGEKISKTADLSSRKTVFDRIIEDTKAPEWMRSVSKAVVNTKLSKVLNRASELAGHVPSGAAFGAGLGALTSDTVREFGESVGFGAGIGVASNLITESPANIKTKRETSDLARFLAGLNETDAANILTRIQSAIENSGIKHKDGSSLTKDQVSELGRRMTLDVADVTNLGKRLSDVDIRFLSADEYNNRRQEMNEGQGQNTAGILTSETLPTGAKLPVIDINLDSSDFIRGSLAHEVLHHLEKLDGMKEYLGDLDKVLFDTTLPGETVPIRTGLYSDKDLMSESSKYIDRLRQNEFETYRRSLIEQLGDARQSDVTDVNALEQEAAVKLGIDVVNQMKRKIYEASNELEASRSAAVQQGGEALKSYLDKVKSEIRAETVRNVYRRIPHGEFQQTLDSKVSRIADRILLGNEFGALRKARQTLEKLGINVSNLLRRGAKSEGGEKPILGMTATPEAEAAVREFLRAKNGIQDKLSVDSSPEITTFSAVDIVSNPELTNRYESWDAFERELVEARFDKDGKLVGEMAVLPQDRQNTAVSGDAIETPDGGKIVIEQRIKRGPSVRNKDGSLSPGTPILRSDREIERMAKDRAKMISKALTAGAKDDTSAEVPLEVGTYTTPMVEVEPGKWRGLPSDNQLKRIMEIPDKFLPQSMKEKIRQIVDQMKTDYGRRFLMEYQPALGKTGKYSSKLGSTLRDEVPIGFFMSKARNFLITTLSMTGFNSKLERWMGNSRLRQRFEPWNGDATDFFTDVVGLMDHYFNTELRGEDYFTAKGDSLNDALKKKNIINDFINIKNLESVLQNPDRVEQDRSDNLIRSRRLDRITRLEPIDSDLPRMRVNYGKQLANYMPSDDKPWSSFVMDKDGKIIEVDDHETFFNEKYGITKDDSFYTTSQGYDDYVEKLYSQVEKNKDIRVSSDKDSIYAEAIHVPSARQMQNLRDFALEQNKDLYFRGKLIEERQPRFDDPQFMPAFYSQLEKTLDEKMPKAAKVSQVLDIINTGVKEDELKWTGIREFLQDKETVTKQELKDYLNSPEGKVEFKETKLHKNSPYPDERKPSFERYSLPGGDNYREVIIEQALPSAAEYAELKYGTTVIAELTPEQFEDIREHSEPTGGEQFRESHWKHRTPYYVAHMRLKDRIDSNGKPGLFVEEFQSDRHQQGRERGYKDTKARNRLDDLEQEVFNIGKKYRLSKDYIKDMARSAENFISQGRTDNGTYDRDFKKLSTSDLTKLVEYTDLRKQVYSENYQTQIPDAPYRKTWHEMLFKRALNEAIETGKDWVGWTDGKTQNDRYNLAKYADAIKWDPTDYRLDVIKGGKSILTKVVHENELPNTIGKEATQKLLASELNKGRYELAGTNLEIGGEGMKGFYDKMLPSFVEKYVKKWGAKVEQDSITSNPRTHDEKMLGALDGMRTVHDGNTIADWINMFHADELEKDIRPEQVSEVIRDMKDDLIVSQRYENDLDMEGLVKYTKENYKNRKYYKKDYQDTYDLIVDAVYGYLDVEAQDIKDAPLNSTFWKVNITPAMREDIMSKGQALFMPKSEETDPLIVEARNNATGENVHDLENKIAAYKGTKQLGEEDLLNQASEELKKSINRTKPLSSFDQLSKEPRKGLEDLSLMPAYNKIQKLGLQNLPTARLFGEKIEKDADWNKIKTPQDLEQYLITGVDPKVNKDLVKTALETQIQAIPDEALPAAAQEFKRNPKRAIETLTKNITDQRSRSIKEWTDYVESNDDYRKDPYWKSLIFDMLKKEFSSERNYGLGEDLPLNAGVLADLRELVENLPKNTNLNLGKKYRELLEKELSANPADSVDSGAGKEWIYIPSRKEDSKNFKENVKKLKALSHKNWCTRSYNADPYLKEGGFWILQDQGKTVAAIRKGSDGSVVEVQGADNNGEPPKEYSSDIETLIKERKVPADVWLAEYSTDSDLLVKLAKDESEGVRECVAKNKNTPPEVLVELAKDKSYYIRAGVAENKNTPPEALVELTKDEGNSYVRARVAENKNTPPEALVELAKDKSEDVRRSVVENKNTPPEALAELAKDKSEDYGRVRVAENENTPPEVLTELAKDESDNIRARVAENKNTPPEALVELAKDKSEDVREYVAKNNNTPPEVLVELAKDKSEDIKKSAKTTLKAIKSKLGDPTQPLSSIDMRLSENRKALKDLQLMPSENLLPKDIAKNKDTGWAVFGFSNTGNPTEFKKFYPYSLNNIPNAARNEEKAYKMINDEFDGEDFVIYFVDNGKIVQPK